MLLLAVLFLENIQKRSVLEILLKICQNLSELCPLHVLKVPQLQSMLPEPTAGAGQCGDDFLLPRLK